MNEESWNKLKEHANKQYETATRLNNSATRLIAHTWKDVLNKMWSIEQETRKK